MSEVTIPENVFVHCPKDGFKLAKAEHCASCQHAEKLLDFQPEAELFIHRYRVLCSYPIARRLEEVNLS